MAKKTGVIRDRDLGFNKLLNIDKAMPKGVKIGIFGGTTADGESIPAYANKNEFGIDVPERPFMRSTFDQEQSSLVSMIKRLVDSYIKGRMATPKQLFSVVGDYLKTKVQERITNASQWAKPNSPVTVRIKGSDKPLIDTGAMRSAITYKVEE